MNTDSFRFVFASLESKQGCSSKDLVQIMSKISKINIIYLLTVVLAVFGSVLTSYIYLATNNLVYTLLASQALLILPALVYIISNKFNLARTIRFNRIKISNVLLVILFSYLVTPLMSLINLISMLFVKNNIQNTIEVIIDQNPLYISIIAIALVPCILEETVYRGIFYNEYRKKNVTSGIILSALLFALLHMNFNQFFYAFVMGIVFVILIEATDTILSSMIMHFVINGTSVLNAYMIPKLQDILEEVDPAYAKNLGESLNASLTRTELLASISSLWPIAIITTIFAAIVLYAIANNSNRVEHIKGILRGERLVDIEPDEGEEETLDKNRLITVPLIIGMVICLVVMVSIEL